MAESSYKAHVLVVDDEEHITELVAMGLGFNGFEVERASSGRGALDAIDKRRPDLIVLDVMLPDLNGFDVARRQDHRTHADRVQTLALPAFECASSADA